MWLGNSGRVGPGHCLEGGLQGCLVQLEGLSRPSVTSQLAQKEAPWVLPLQNSQARKILAGGHPGPFISLTDTCLHLIEISG
uniref:Uncharacterized protein n=1 Tax=Oryctolagus cuniculus TaxID=9986 RepID=A0A5F9D667_RABIT